MSANLDKLRDAHENERLRSTLRDLLPEVGAVRDWADALQELADAIEDADSSIETWAEAEDREEKADAKEAAVESLGTLVEAWEQIAGLSAVEQVVTSDVD